jgi:2'-5' RNA ligase
MRLFLAIELSEPVRRVIAELSREWRENWNEELLGIGTSCPPASWVRAENLHITLKFLGETPDTQIPRICDALKTTSTHPIRLLPDRIECFPVRGPVRVIGVGLGGELERVNELFQDVEQACEPLGFALERRAYRPHITLARIRSFLPSHARRTLMEAGAKHLPGPEFVVNQFVLMQSQLNPKGARYTALARFPLVEKD